MNCKFILFCVTTVGCILLVYMWFTMHKTLANNQLSKGQFSFRISSLKSEINFEKRLMESLRKDAKSLAQSYQEKNTIFENLKKKVLSNDNVRVKMEKDIELLKLDYDKVSKSNEELMKKLKAEQDSQKLIDNTQIEKLTNEFEKLKKEHAELLSKQTGLEAKNNELNNIKLNKIDDIMQAKPPKINKSISKAQLDESQLNRKNNQDVGKLDSDTRVMKPKSENAKNISLSDKKKEMKEEKSNLKSQDNNKNIENSHDDDISKDGFFQKKPINPKILFRQDDKQQNVVLKKPKISNHETKKIEMEDMKLKEEGENNQLKPPQNEDRLKNKIANNVGLKKFSMKKENDIKP